MLLILAAVFGLLTFILAFIVIPFPLEWRVAKLAKTTKKALDAFDEAKGKMWLARKERQDVSAEVVAVKSALQAAADALARERKSGTSPQAWCYIAVLWGGGLAAYCLFIGLLSLIHSIALWTGFWLVLFGIVFYFGKLYFDLSTGKAATRRDIDLVKEDEIGMKTIFRKPYRVVSSGSRLALRGVIEIVHVPTRLVLYKIREDNVMTAGAEAARWILDMTIRFRMDRDIWNLVRFLGIDIERIKKELMGEVDENGKRITRGIVGDEITAIARSWIGNADNIATVDEGIGAQDRIAAVIDHDLELALSLYGLVFDLPNITDFDVEKDVADARTQRTSAKVGVDTAKHQAAQEREKGFGERDRQKALAEAEAFRNEAVIKAKIAALTTMTTKGPEWALNLLTLLVVGEEGLEKLKSIGTINLFALEGISGIVSQITSALSGSGGENEVMQMLKNLPSDQAAKITDELKKLLKGGSK